MVVLISKPKEKIVEVPKEIVKDSDILTIRNLTGSQTIIQRVDFNNDGVDEVVFLPKSLSRYNGAYILNDNLKPLCENCEFSYYENGIRFVDVEPKEGNIEIVIDGEPGERYDGREFIEGGMYEYQGNDFVMVQ